jgi:hypothetical protein
MTIAVFMNFKRILIILKKIIIALKNSIKYTNPNDDI